MTASAERLAARRNTRAFINADPVVVTFRRPNKEVTEAGGQREGTPSSIPPQTCRLVPLSGNVWNRSKMTTDEGNLPDVTHQLVGMPDLDAQKDDTFEANGVEWLVTHVEPDRSNRTSCNVVVR